MFFRTTQLGRALVRRTTQLDRRVVNYLADCGVPISHVALYLQGRGVVYFVPFSKFLGGKAARVAPPLTDWRTEYVREPFTRPTLATRPSATLDLTVSGGATRLEHA